jgi:hypothetical protein
VARLVGVPIVRRIRRSAPFPSTVCDSSITQDPSRMPMAHCRRRIGRIKVWSMSGGPDLVKSEFELGDDTEVAVAATQPPEQVLMVRLAYP